MFTAIAKFIVLFFMGAAALASAVGLFVGLPLEWMGYKWSEENWIWFFWSSIAGGTICVLYSGFYRGMLWK